MKTCDIPQMLFILPPSSFIPAFALRLNELFGGWILQPEIRTEQILHLATPT